MNEFIHNCEIKTKRSVHIAERYDDAKEMIKAKYLNDNTITLDIGLDDWLIVYLDKENASRLLVEITTALNKQGE